MSNRKRHIRGRGTVYKDEEPGRTTKWRAEKYVRLPDGRRKRIKVRGRTVDEALDLLDERVKEAQRTNPDAKRLTVSQYFDIWLDHKATTLRASSLHAYRQDFRLYIEESIGGVQLARVATYQLQSLINEIVNDGHPAMADRVYRTLRAAFRQAVRWDYIATNPIDGVEPVRRPQVKRSAWDAKNALAFLKVARDSNYYLAFVLAITAGLRRGEIVTLEWGDIAGNLIHVRRTASVKAPGGVAPPKTEAGARTVRVADEVAALLAEHRGADDDPVFPGRGSRYTNPRTLNREFELLLEKVDVPKIRFHDLRRTYATLLADGGAPPKAIQKLLGHSTWRLAMEVYLGVLADQEAAAVVDLGGGSFGGTGGTSGGNPSVRDDTGEGEDGE
ncbi:MAG TPA: tyrosine-type recombinase/integrase, partial [Beutenbergiaceae bacterium]|nr:tyrosine-type recombinase/integrase [Beutenbergiaceae bacterium]